MKFLVSIFVFVFFWSFGFSQSYWQGDGTAIRNTNSGAVNVGSLVGTGDASFQIGDSRTDNGHAYFDLVSDVSNYSGFGARLIRFGKGPNAGITRFEHRGGGDMEFKASDNGPINFVRSGQAISLHIASDGKIGIGTKNPGSFQLAVEGNIGSREVQVTANSPFPDYVFDDNYDMLSLDALGTYIAKHKHLPNIPSAKEVEENGGFELGDMSLRLLEKIEELTLYIIKQEERIKALENSVNK